MKKWAVSIIGMVLVTLMAAPLVYAHCQLPCGIYDDGAKIAEIRQDIVTIEKAMNQIQSISKNMKNADAEDYNQLVRWTTNKEAHATRIQNAVADYFLAQRIKPNDKQDFEKLKVLHNIMVNAMKAKQTVDLQYIEKLRSSVDEFETLYFGKKQKAGDSHSE